MAIYWNAVEQGMHQKQRHRGVERREAHSLQLLLLLAVPVEHLAHALLCILLPRSVASEARLGHQTTSPVLCRPPRMLSHVLFCTWGWYDQRWNCLAVLQLLSFKK